MVDGQVAYTMPVPEEAKKIIGLSIHFEGAGEVKKVSLGHTAGHGLFPITQAFSRKLRILF